MQAKTREGGARRREPWDTGPSGCAQALVRLARGGGGPPQQHPHHPLHDDYLGPQRLADGEDVHEPEAEHGEVQREDNAPGVQRRGRQPGRARAGASALRPGPGPQASRGKGTAGRRQTRVALTGSREARATREGAAGHAGSCPGDRDSPATPFCSSGSPRGARGHPRPEDSHVQRQPSPRGWPGRAQSQARPGGAHLQASPAMKSRMAATSSLFQKSLKYSTAIFLSPHPLGS